ncbi:MAG: hypothetical protein AXA67_01450 [Methylothermaceae bacteria B42]|nr:MAG: hypothetical protein AXA67_01450 [Methylothermaceae bacteria B42]HHJ39056.1 YciI family protein [Methylothermaceae bacterium]
MLYAIICEDADNSLNLRRENRPAHLQRLEKLQDDGRLVLAGPHPAIDSPDPGEAGFTGSLIVAEFPSLEAAKKWVDEDPYLKAGVYQKVIIKPFLKVFPK